MIEKLNPADPRGDDPTPKTNARILGYGAILALYGAVVAGALLVRARSRRSVRPNLLDLAVIAAGILGMVAVGDRMLQARARAAPPADDDARFSHPAINVQRISFA